MLEADFARLDANRDGMLHFEELIAGISRTGPSGARVTPRIYCYRPAFVLPHRPRRRPGRLAHLNQYCYRPPLVLLVGPGGPRVTSRTNR